MNELRTSTHIESPGNVPIKQDELRSQVWLIVSVMYPGGLPTQRRKETRYPYPKLMYITPVDSSNSPVGETFVVVGKTISEKGIGFHHERPLSYRRVIISVEGPNACWMGLLVDLTWCCCTKFGWYESGGPIQQIIPSPVADPQSRVI